MLGERRGRIEGLILGIHESAAPGPPDELLDGCGAQMTRAWKPTSVGWMGDENQPVALCWIVLNVRLGNPPIPRIGN